MTEISVQVKINYILEESYTQQKSGVYKLLEGSNVRTLLARLELGQKTELLTVVVNGKAVNDDTVLCDGDQVVLLPLLCGG